MHKGVVPYPFNFSAGTGFRIDSNLIQFENISIQKFKEQTSTIMQD